MSDYNLGTASGRIVVDGSPAEKGFAVARTAGEAFFDTIRSRVADVQNLGKKLAVVGTAGALSLGGAIKVAAGFEQQMSAVGAVAGASEEQMEKLRQKALDLGKDTTFSASEAAGALEELIKAGISVEDALNGGADAAVALAAAGGIDIPQAAEIAANAMNQFELSADQVVGVADTLAGVANTSAADVSGIGQALSQAGAVANLAGLSFDDTAIAIGEMANAGIKGSDAGTSLKTMLNNLIPTTEKQSNKFEELGLLTYDLQAAQKALVAEGLQPVKGGIDEVKASLSKYLEEQGKGNTGTVKNAKAVDDLLQKYGGLNNAFFDAKGNVKDLEGLQGTLGKALEGLTREQKLSTLETLFGADAMRASAILSLEGAAGYRKFAEAVGETSAAEVAKTRLDNLAGATEQFKGAIETAMITVGSVFLPLVTKMIQFLTFLVNGFNNLPGPIKVAIAILAAIASAGLLVVGMILTMLPLIASMVVNYLALKVIKNIISGFKIFFATLRGGLGVQAATAAGANTTSTAMSRLTARTLLASRAARVFGTAMLFVGRALKAVLLNPYVLAILAIVGLGVLLYKKWKPFRDLVDSVGRSIKSGFNKVVEASKPLIASFLATMVRFGNYLEKNIVPVVKDVAASVKKDFLDGFKKVSAVFKSDVLPALHNLADTFQAEILPALKDAVTKLAPVVKQFVHMAAVIAGIVLPVLAKIANFFFKYIFPVMAKFAGFILGVVIGAIVEFANIIQQSFNGAIQMITGFINFFKAVFTGDWKGAWEAVKQIASGFLKTILAGLRTVLLVGFGKVVKLGMGLVGKLFRAGWGLVRGIFRVAGRAIMVPVRAAMRLIGSIVRNGMNLARNVFSRVWAFIRGVFNKATGALRNTVGKFLANILAAVRGRFNAVFSVIKAVWNRIVATVKGLVARLVALIKSGLDRIVAFFRGLVGRITSAFSGLAGKMYDIGKNIISSMMNGIKSVVGDLANAARDAAKGALKAVTDVFKIGSPSRVFTQIGEWTIEGAEIGVDKRAPKLAAEGAKAARKMVEGYSRAFEVHTRKQKQPDLGKKIIDVPLNYKKKAQKQARDAARVWTKNYSREIEGIARFDVMPTIDRAPITTNRERAELMRGQRKARDAEQARREGKRRTTSGEQETRLIRGTLKLTGDDAYIRAIAEDAVDDSNQARERWERMN